VLLLAALHSCNSYSRSYALLRYCRLQLYQPAAAAAAAEAAAGEDHNCW
jgi:hypothetical protein